MNIKNYNNKENFHHLPYYNADAKGRLSFINSKNYFSAHLIEECTAAKKLRPRI